MALPFGDNVHTKFFTPKEYQVELLEAAISRNIIACIGNLNTKTFIASKLIQEVAIRTQRSRRRKSVMVVDNQHTMHYASAIKYLTDLDFVNMTEMKYTEETNFDLVVNKSQVILCRSEQTIDIITNRILDVSDICLLIVDDCHNSICEMHPLRKLMNCMANQNIRIFGMTDPLYTTDELKPGEVEAELDELEKAMHCKVETASEIVSILRFQNKCQEHLVECEVGSPSELDDRVRSEVNNVLKFLQDHRHDLSEIYDTSEYMEDIEAISDPTVEPIRFINEFLEVLNSMGPWCANKAALSILYSIERVKTKTPWERHFMLLGLVTSLMIRIRYIFDEYFSKYTESELIYDFITPKVQRLIDVLLEHKPSKRVIMIDAVPESAKVQDDSSPINEALSSNTTNCSEEIKTVLSFMSKSGDEPAEDSLTICNSYLRYKSDKATRWKHRKRTGVKPTTKMKAPLDETENICSLIFVNSRHLCLIIHYFLCDLKKYDNANFWWITPQYTPEKSADPEKEPMEALIQHRNLEDVLRKFRMKECNILISTSVLEEGIDLPKCNLVIRFDIPKTFHSYVHSKSKASANHANFFVFFESPKTESFIDDLAKYYEVQQLLLNRCYNKVESDSELSEAELYKDSVVAYRTGTEEDCALVTMETAIACVNKYCAKLPSDSFTRLTPMWTTKSILYNEKLMFVTILRFPINSPFKNEIKGHPMPTKMLSKQVAALEACRKLHVFGELDHTLQVIGKEGFHQMFGFDELLAEGEPADEDPRPGTNKRRQFYEKKMSSHLTYCHPVSQTPLYFYNIKMKLSCPIPEEQNTRGRKIHAPEDSPQGFGIILTKHIPKVCSFPIFTRSGEEMISLEMYDEMVYLTDEQLNDICEFMKYTLTKVLKLNVFYLKYDPINGPFSYYIVPTCKKSSNSNPTVDWEFLKEINRRKDEILSISPDENRRDFVFDEKKYADAVIMPWYRNQDCPQHFYVAEICSYLTPQSSFPGNEYNTFEDYYYRKYNLRIQNLNQPLLDVDHTSARLNFLTPRYVNRKGVALPTCSESTKRAKRECLEQKQILVPELCRVHPFPASMWRKAVSLPCILYRINSLLLAEDIRRTVSKEIQLGVETVPIDFQWPRLDFGWTLADVIQRTKELKEAKLLKEVKAAIDEDVIVNMDGLLDQLDNGVRAGTNERITAVKDDEVADEIIVNGDVVDGEDADEKASALEIGMWSNEMARDVQDFSAEFQTNFSEMHLKIRYGSPTSWLQDEFEVESYASDESDDSDNVAGIQIEFRGDFCAEALDHDRGAKQLAIEAPLVEEIVWERKKCVKEEKIKQYHANFELAVDQNKRKLFEMKSWLIRGNDSLSFQCSHNKSTTSPKPNDNKSKTLPWLLTSDTGYGLRDELDIKWDEENDAVYTADKIEKKLKNGLVNRIDVDEFHEEELWNGPTKDYDFSFDLQPELRGHVGPSPSILLQSLTMSNANDGINLERLETIGDSFLKYAITSYLYCTFECVHEGKLSHVRSRQVSNFNLYKLGRKKMFGEYMVSSKFEPFDNWLPPCFRVPVSVENALVQYKSSSCFWPASELPYLWNASLEDVTFEKHSVNDLNDEYTPYNLITYHTIPDKSIADCVEALIGAYLIECGIRGALLFMTWLGIRVLPQFSKSETDKAWLSVFERIKTPPSPLTKTFANAHRELDRLLVGYEEFEHSIGYKFNDRSYLLQAMTHASYFPNRVTDCYQRLEFLGDAVLDYLITRHLYEDKRQHSPGSLTDLRSALVNNTIFAALAIRYGFHRYFRHLSPGLADVIHKFVRIQEENDHAIFEEYYLISEDECEEAEDVEVPKALGDIFESVAGAIYLDSGRSLDTVWSVYHKIMKNEIEQFSNNVPKSPIRELLELEPETAKFGRPEKLADGKRVRVTVEVFGKGIFKGIGRNYRIAKCTAAKCALKQLKKQGLLSKNDSKVGGK